MKSLKCICIFTVQGLDEMCPSNVSSKASVIDEKFVDCVCLEALEVDEIPVVYNRCAVCKDMMKPPSNVFYEF